MFNIIEEDQKGYKQKIQPLINEGKQINLFCSFTYITPNYTILFALHDIKKLIKDNNFKIFLVL